MLKRLWFSLAISTLLFTRVWGEINAPDITPLGKLIPVECTDEADIYIWTIPDGLDTLVLEGNKKFVCTGLEGAYKIQVTAIKVDWDNKKLTQLPQQTKTITIGKVNPPTPPTPPTPEPDLTGLAKEVYTWGAAVTGYKECAIQLSTNYKVIADKYNKMELTLEKALDDLRIRNNQTLDTREKKDAWAVFGSRLEEKMNAAWPMDKTAMVAFLNDIALGLSYVK